MTQQLKMLMDNIRNFILDLIFPKFCASCKKEGRHLCLNCSQELQINHYSFCSVCKNKTPNLQKCARHKTYLKFFFSPFSYDNTAIKNLIHNFKYEFIKSIGPELAYFQIQTLKNSSIYQFILENPQNFLITAVPLHKKRLAWRGFNQSEILAKEISQKLNIKLFSELKRIKNTKPQIDMADHKEREQNIKEAFICKNNKKIKNKTIILVDDMITTGATMEECAKILKKSGAKEIWGLTIAK